MAFCAEPAATGCRPMRVQPEDGRAAVVRRHEDGHAHQHVLEDRLVVAQVPLVLHPELGEGAAAHDGHARERARGHQAPGDGQRVHGAAAEPLHVDPGRAHAARGRGHGLGQVAAAALVAIAHRLLAAVEHVLDARGIDALGGEEPAQRHGRRDLRGEVLEQHVGGERGVLGVARRDRADAAARRPGRAAARRRHRPGARRAGSSRARSAGVTSGCPASAAWDWAVKPGSSVTRSNSSAALRRPSSSSSGTISPCGPVRGATGAACHHGRGRSRSTSGWRAPSRTWVGG